MLVKTSWYPKPANKKPNDKGPVWKLSKDKHRALVAITANLMRMAEPTPFAMEAPRRHAIRADLCLQSWPWIIADVIADSVVRAALHRIGARRPRWIEGQRDFCHGAYLRDDVACWECGSPLPPWRKKFCGDECQRKSDNARAHQRWIRSHVNREEGRPEALAMLDRIRARSHRPLPSLRSSPALRP